RRTHSHLDTRRQVAVVAGLLTDRDGKSDSEARSIARAAAPFPDIEVEPFPEDETFPVGTPVPVVRLFEYRDVGTSRALSIFLSFRYGTEEVDPDSPVMIVPEEEPTTEGGEPSGRRRYLLRDTAGEKTFLDALEGATSFALEQQQEDGTTAPPNRQNNRENDRGERPPLTMQAFLLYAVPALLDEGFEILLGRKRVSRSTSTPRYRVVESDEDWLTVEPGLFDGDRFLPLEGVDAFAGTHLLQAGDRYYLITSPVDIHLLQRTLGRERISTGDLLGLGEVEELLLDRDHPALERYRKLRDRLSRVERLESVSVPPSFQGTLRPYQEHGLAWLWFLHTSDLGGCLADDMGLGKTIQTLALLTLAREAGEMRRALVVAPVSTLGNWTDEASRFTPGFTSHIHAGPDRHRMVDDLSGADLVFVSYDILRRDRDALAALEPDYLILDEAQAIKNPGSKRRAAAASIPARHRLALSGTPVENGVSELWSLLDVVTPGILGSHSAFRRRFAGVEEDDSVSRERLRKTVRPLILRRTKGAVAPELPPKEEILLRAEAGGRQARFYEELRAHWEAQVKGALGDPTQQFRILEAMLRLRQAAILPALVDPRHSGISGAKLDLLIDRLGQIFSEGNKALVFSQFLGVLDEVERRLLHAHSASWSPEQVFRLEGSTPQRERSSLIKGFQSVPGAAVFLISLKAGGTGINLTAADYVFLMDPWWNPAVEAQAVDRAHRIGREGTVIAYRVITAGTIEEKMVRLQEKKRSLADALVQDETTGLRELTPEEIGALFAATPSSASSLTGENDRSWPL
ncbi:MAG: DEAD/DEAH box helicase, partial [Alkalispirochaeta sp.]